MYFARDIEQKLVEWKNTPGHLTAYVEGARQVGKTTMIEHFIENNYSQSISVRTDEDRKRLELLLKEPQYTTRDMIREYARAKGKDFSDTNDTVLFIDEVQESKVIYQYIRFFTRDLECDVIVTGSYLHLASSYFQPVGDVSYFTVYPMSFQEVLGALGVRRFYENKALAEFTKDELNKLWQIWNAYTVVGGYPAVVKVWLADGDFSAMQGSIWDTVTNEINARHPDVIDTVKFESAMHSIINFIVNNKRGSTEIFDALSKITENYDTGRISKKELYNILAWVYKTGFITYVDKIDLVSNTLKENEKVFFVDLGMFTYMCKKCNINASNYHGFLAETYVCRVLIDQGVAPTFGVFDNNELDFVVRLGNNVYGVEVKNNKDKGDSVSLALQKRFITEIIYFKEASYGKTVNKTTIPLPLAWRYKFEADYDKVYAAPTASEIRDLITKDLNVF